MRYLPSGTQMQQADQYTIKEIGIPSLVLMERAGLGMVEILEQEQAPLQKTLIVCGSGNNGGDGFVIARLLKEKQIDVTVVFAGNETSMSEECRLQKQIWEKLGGKTEAQIPNNRYTAIIDAVFGVGLSREVSGSYAEMIENMNQLSGYKAAVDIPSGVHAESGKILGTAFRAELTVAFQCEKLGCVLFPGASYAGKVVPAEIGVSTEPLEEKKSCYTLDKKDLRERLPKRKANSHKGSYGKLLMITGSKGMSGAAYLSAKAAYTVGAGLVQIYTAEENRVILQQLLPEAIVSTYEHYEEGQLHKLIDWADVVCIGCGLGQEKDSEMLLKQTLQYAKCPCVIDADGLNLLSSQTELLKSYDQPIILTPHMKEMAGLLHCEIAELAENRFSLLREFVENYPAVCVLKDARTVVAEKDRAMFVNTAGNQAMAKAGSGDVLAGVISGLLSQHMDAGKAAVTGVFLHAKGGDEARDDCGSYSVLAEDLIKGVQTCMKKTEEQI